MRDLLHRIPAVKKLGLVAAAALLAAASTVAPRPAQAVTCHDWTEYYTYFTDATETTEAGWCEYDCYCVSECSGVKTAYYSHAVWSGCL